MKIAIIGGSGFIGTYLMEELIGKFDFINIDKSQSVVFSANTIIADVRNDSKLQEAIPNETEVLILLAAEHRDDVTPISLYYDVNVGGAKNVVKVAREKKIRHIIFTSSVAIYGLNKKNPDETFSADPFNDYGKSKLAAEEILQSWHKESEDENILTVIRPTVVFGPRNKGNVYNLLKQISSGKFIMIGNGKNIKSMAYVENIVKFILFTISNSKRGFSIFNYADKPDLSTNELVKIVEISLNKSILSMKVPYLIGYLGGVFLDIAAKLLRRKFSISAVRIKKFCATTQFSSNKMYSTGFLPPFTLAEGLAKTLQSIKQNNDQDA